MGKKMSTDCSYGKRSQLLMKNSIYAPPQEDLQMVPIASALSGREVDFKRMFDIVFALVAVLTFLPLLLILGIAVIWSSQGPAIYAHNRIGKDGKIFPCLKFRTMVEDADERLQELLDNDPQARAEFEKTHKLENDPRIIPGIGHLLRNASLDELPQFLNVLAGQMSVVGPRPVTQKELDGYNSARRFYTSVRPGITGLWQVSGRSEVDFQRRTVMDRQYVTSWTFFLDIKIIFKTVGVVFSQVGAK